MADPANANGSAFGGIRAGNAAFVGSSGVVGISAANVAVQDVVTIGDIYATDSASPSLAFGSNSQFGSVRIAGGDLLQGNSKAIANSGYNYDVVLAAGETSGGAAIAAANTYGQLSFTQTPASVASATSKQFDLTANIDSGASFTGGSANDTFNATGATLTAGDSLVGGAGTDTLAISAVAANALNSASVSTSGIEAIRITNSDANTTQTLDAALMVGVTDIYATGGVRGFTVSNITSIPNVHVTNNTGIITVNATATTVVGTADTATVALNKAVGSLTYNGIETLNVVTAGNATGSSATRTDARVTFGISSDSLSNLTVSGDQRLVADVTFDTTQAPGSSVVFDASASTASVDVKFANLGDSTGSENNRVSIVGSAGNDTIDLNLASNSLRRNDVTATAAANTIALVTVNGGAGTDTLVVAETITFDSTAGNAQPGANITGFEALSLTANKTVDFRALSSSNSFASAQLSAGGSLSKAPTSLNSLEVLGNGAIAYSRVADTSSDTGLVVNLNAELLANSFNNTITANDEESLTITSAGGETVTGNTITTLSVTDATSLTLNGAKPLTISTLTTSSTLPVTVNAGAHTGATFSLGAGTAATALTVTASAGAPPAGSANANNTVNTITTGSGADRVTGGAYRDSITTGAGNDTVYGGAGNDSITLDAGNDVAYGEAGNDTINGGDGNDMIDGGAGTDDLSDGAGDDTVMGGDDADTIRISTGRDSVDAGAGNDSITVTEWTSADTINGGDGTDSLTVTNSSSTTIAPTFTSIESIAITTSSALNLNLTNATGASSLTSFTIAGSSIGANNVTVTNAVSGSTFTISDDNTWDGASATDTDNDGNIEAVTLDTTAGGTLTLNVGANEDALTHIGTVLAGTSITDAATVTINSKNADSYTVTNNLGGLTLSAEEARELTITAERYAGLTVGNVINAGNVATLTVTSNADTTSNLGTVADISRLETLSATATGTNSSLTLGAMGATVGTALKNVTLHALNGATLDSTTITASSSATTGGTVSLKASGAGALLDVAAINLGTTTLSSLAIEVDTNATLEVAAGSLTSGAITRADVTLRDFSTLRDNGADGNEILTVTGPTTTLNVSLGRSLTHAAGDRIDFSGSTGTLNLTTTLAAETIAMSAGNTLAYNGNAIMDFGTIATAANYTHTGSGTLDWNGSAIAGAQGVSANTSSTAAATITGGGANDTLTGNEGANTLSGGGGVDSLSGRGGADSLSGGDGNDSLNGGEGADTLDGGAGNDTLNLTESLSAADVVQIRTNGTASESPEVKTATASDTGSDTISAFDLAADTVQVIATGVVNFDPAVHVKVGTGVAAEVAGTTGAISEFATTTVVVDVTGAAANTAIAVGAGDIVFNLSSTTNAGVSVTTLTDAAVQARMQYNLTGDATANTIKGGPLADTITGGAGADLLTGGGAADRFVYGSIAQSKVTTTGGAVDGVDRITDFAGGTDVLSLPVAVGGTINVGSTGADLSIAVDVASTGTSVASLLTDLQTAATARQAASAGLFAQAGDTFVVKITGASLAGTDVFYVVQNDGTNSLVTEADLIIALTGSSTGGLTVATVVGP